MKPAPRHAVLVVCGALVACAAPAVSIVTTPTPTSLRNGNARITPAHLWVEQGETATYIRVFDTTRPAAPTALPMGVPARDWSRLYAVMTSGSGQVLRAIDPVTGGTISSISIPPGFDLPYRGPGGHPVGLSPDGSRLVLAGGVRNADGVLVVSSFLVYETSSLARSPQRVTITGNLSFDGISNDGRSLYLLEDLSASTTGGSYHVRRYDLSADVLDPAVIVDKRTGERSLSGAAIDSINSLDGAWQFTVYAFGTGAPMVHALNLEHGFAFCIDLPSAPTDQALDLLWGLAASHDGQSVYAANAANGAVIAMPLASPWQARRASLPVSSPVTQSAWTPWSTITAEAKRIAYGAAAISPDDRTLYSISGHGLVAIDTANLRIARILLPGQALSSVLVSPDGGHIYVVRTESGPAVIQLDIQSGNWVSLAGVDAPVAVLRVVP
jgi:hypothetical protein